MPLVRIDLPAGKPTSYRDAVSETVQAAPHAALNVPTAECFHVVSEHPPGALRIDPGYLGVHRSPDAMVIQVTLNGGRDAPTKVGLDKALADGLHGRAGLRREDVPINLVEVGREDWSFGKGEAQLA